MTAGAKCHLYVKQQQQHHYNIANSGKTHLPVLRFVFVIDFFWTTSVLLERPQKVTYTAKKWP